MKSLIRFIQGMIYSRHYRNVRGEDMGLTDSNRLTLDQYVRMKQSTVEAAWCEANDMLEALESSNRNEMMER